MIIQICLMMKTGHLYIQEDDNFFFIKNQIPKQFDIIFLENFT